MAKTSSRSQAANPEKKDTKSGLVCCMDCLYSKLLQYGRNPVLAECHRQPQPGNARFPYRREVARPLRYCAMHRHTDEAKVIEQHVGHLWEAKAA